MNTKINLIPNHGTAAGFDMLACAPGGSLMGNFTEANFAGATRASVDVRFERAAAAWTAATNFVRPRGPHAWRPPLR